MAMTLAMTVTTSGIETLCKFNIFRGIEITKSVPDKKKEKVSENISEMKVSPKKKSEAGEKDDKTEEVLDTSDKKSDDITTGKASEQTKEETITETTPSVPEAEIIINETSIAFQKEGIIYGKNELEFSAGIYQKESGELEKRAEQVITQGTVEGWLGEESLETTTYQWNEQKKVILDSHIPNGVQAMVKENYVLTARYEENILDTKEVTVVWDCLAPEISLEYSKDELAELEKVRSQKVILNYRTKDKEVQTENKNIISGIGVEKVLAVFESKIPGGYVPETIETDSLETVEIDVEEGKEFHGICKLYAVDYLGNASEPVEISLNIDKAEPEIKIIKGENTDWQEEVIITAKAEDYCFSKEPEKEAEFWIVFEESGVIKKEDVTYTKNLQESTENKDVYDITIHIKKSKYRDYSGLCTIYATDTVGNKVTYQNENNQFQVHFDSTAPQFEDVTITDVNKKEFEKICNKLSFGIFCKDKIQLEVQGADVLAGGGASGVKSMVMYADGVQYMPVKVSGDGIDSYVATFLLDAEKKTEDVLFSMEDNAGNDAKASIGEINQSYGTSGIYIDKASPYIVIKTVAEDFITYKDKKKRKWYDGHVLFEIKAGDNLSGFETIEVEINGKKLKKDIEGSVIQEKMFQNTCVTEKTFYISTSQSKSQKDAQGKENGRYDISISITDHAGNTIEKTKTVYVDELEPYIEGVEVKGEGKIEGDGSLTSKKKYAYFVRGNAQMIVTAADDKGSSGVKSITYYTVNYADDSESITSEKTTVSVDKNNQITIKLNSGFKGMVYLKATDNTNHSTSQYEHPHLIVTGSKKVHMMKSKINITLPEEVAQDKNNFPLYRDNVTATLQISDKDMGLAAVEWSVTSDYDKGTNIHGNLKVDKLGNVTNNNVFNVEIKDKNLVTEMYGKIPINCDSNQIRIWLKTTDRAGMTTEKEVFLSIDKQKPVVEVTYDNNDMVSDSAGETEYYKDNRTATIVVKERNFDEKNVQVKVTNAEGELPVVTVWEKAVNTASPDNTTNTAKVIFASDGDYTFEVIAEDKAGNQADIYPQDKFVIDKTKPEIEISFDKNNGVSGNYYGEERTATITIKEHNFESSQVEITGNHMGIENNHFPGVGGFTSTGDVHQTSLNFTEDGVYSFNVTYTDKAGNEAELVSAEEFYIDTKEPEIMIEGVQAYGAYKEEVASVITCKDENVDSNSLKAVLRIVNQDESQSVNAVQQGKLTNYKEGCRLQMKSPEQTKEWDGIYCLDVEIKDLAGNLHKETLEYSVNRFGSVYTLETEAEKAAGNYVKTTEDIEIVETNADEIQQTQVKLTKNGEITQLEEEKDYYIKETHKEGGWKQYRYVIKKDNFKEDGVYMITLSSKDKAGNINENTAEEKEAELWFGVDATSPVIVPLNVEEGKSYNLTELEAQVEVQDNLKLNSVKAYVNDVEAELKESDKQSLYTLLLTESTKGQNLRIVATDAAGNELVREVKGIYITTNPWIRFIHSRMAVAVIGGAVTVIFLIVAAFILLRKKKVKK